LLAGVVGCFVAARYRHSFQWSVGGLVLSIVALIVNLFLLPGLGLGHRLLGMG
jgi:hypothetical protein